MYSTEMIIYIRIIIYYIIIRCIPISEVLPSGKTPLHSSSEAGKLQNLAGIDFETQGIVISVDSSLVIRSLPWYD